MSQHVTVSALLRNHIGKLMTDFPEPYQSRASRLKVKIL
jgi:hypothetical protein